MILYPQEAHNDYCREIVPGVWIMDDHKWALYVWRINRNILPDILFHADYHWDGDNDFPGDDLSLVELLDNQSRLKRIISKDQDIRKVSFISPAVRAKWFREIHFYCYQRNIAKGLNTENLINKPVRQFVHTSQQSVLENLSGKSVAFDLDVDLFNHSTFYGKGDLWPDHEILTFLDNFGELIRIAPLVTIALSYFYSGTMEDTRHLAELILPKILSLRNIEPNFN